MLKRKDFFLFFLISSLGLILIISNFFLQEKPSFFSKAQEFSSATITFQQGVNNYQGTTSSYIFSWYPDKNFQSENKNLIYTTSAFTLIRFDLSSLPQNAKIDNAALTLCAVSKYGSSTSPLSIKVFPLIRSWNPKTVTWFQADIYQEWTKPGAQDPIQDRKNNYVANLGINNVGCYNFPLTSIVQRWVAYPQTNKGIILASLEGAGVGYFFADESYPTVSSRPKLTISYTLSPTNNLPPYVSFTSPSSEQFITDPFALEVITQDDKGISRVEYYLDGNKITSLTNPPYIFSLVPGHYSLGTHLLTAKVFDDIGQQDEDNRLVNFYQKDDGVITLAQISDNHLESSSLYPQRLTQVLQEIKDVIKPALIIDTGDLVTTPSTANYQLYSNIINNLNLKIPLKIIPGNHDLTDGGASLKNALSAAKEKFFLDIENYRLLGIGCYKIAQYQNWAENLLKENKKEIIFSHYPVVLPPDKASNSLYQMSPSEKTALIYLFRNFSPLFYFSGHVHERFLLEEPETLVPNLSVLATTQKSGYEIITLDNGIISSNVTYINESPRWPVVVITSPQSFYGLNNQKIISGIVKIRAKIFDPNPINTVEYKIDSENWIRMEKKGFSVYEKEWDTAGYPGVHTLYVKAINSLGNQKITQIKVNVSSSVPSPTPPSPLPTVTPSPSLPTNTPTLLPTNTPTPTPTPSSSSCPSSCPQITSYSSGKETDGTCWVELSWKPVPNATSYKIVRNSSTYKTTTQTTYRWRWLPCNNTSLYKVNPLALGCQEIQCQEVAIKTP
ncbi:MAG: DNRLRE domain-containing protein [Microgenomates group bacterium]